MSSTQLNETTTPSEAQTAVNTSPDRRLGRVKWFNNKAGYGFLKVVENDGKETDDVFVHHSSIKVSKEQFKYLVQGEYIDFTIGAIESGEHKFQATEVSGVNGCKLMCETRNEAFKSRGMQSSSGTQGGGSEEGRSENQPREYRVRPSRQSSFSGQRQPQPPLEEQQPRQSRPPRTAYSVKQKQPFGETTPQSEGGKQWSKVGGQRKF
jgi:cold shock CspA family protein